MSLLFYSNGVLTSSLLRAYDPQSFMDDTRNGFLNSQWTLVRTVSGFAGTTGYVMLSVKPLFGQKIKCQFSYDGIAIRFRIMDQTETYNASAGMVAIESQKIQRMICGPFQWFIFFDQSVSPGTTQFAPPFQSFMTRNDTSGGIPVLTSDVACFWSLGQQNSWRFFTVPQGASSVLEFAFLLNGVLYSNDTISTNVILPELLGLRGTTLQEVTPFQDGNYALIAPYFAMGTYSGVLFFPLWDAFVLSQRLATKLTTTVDFHSFEAFTLTNSTAECACLWLATGNFSGQAIGGYSH